MPPLGRQRLDLVSDEVQLQRATDQDRALLTFNYVDFLRLGRARWEADQHHAGIVVSYRQYSCSELGELAKAVSRLLEAVDAESLRDGTFVLDAFRRTACGPAAGFD